MNDYNPIPAIVIIVAVACLMAVWAASYAGEINDGAGMLLCPLGADCGGAQ